MISGAWANSNYDDDNNTRQKLLKQIDEFVSEAIRSIYSQGEKVEEIDMNSPFFAAMKVPKIDPVVNSESLGEVNGR